MQATRLCIIRHGETAWNAERRIQGQLDEPLSSVGHAQARATANGLAREPSCNPERSERTSPPPSGRGAGGWPLQPAPGRPKAAAFAAIYSSDLARARQTAEATAHLLKLPITLRPELRERHYGVFQTLTYGEMRSRYPQEYARFKAREIDFAFPEGGESLRQFSGRILRCIGEIVARHAGGQVLVFTHGGVLDILHRRTSGKPLSAPRDFEIPNAALNWLEIADGRWSMLAWADRGHLTEALDELPG